jgi:hypothetical protein
MSEVKGQILAVLLLLMTFGVAGGVIYASVVADNNGIVAKTKNEEVNISANAEIYGSQM